MMTAVYYRLPDNDGAREATGCTTIILPSTGLCIDLQNSLLKLISTTHQPFRRSRSLSPKTPFKMRKNIVLFFVFTLLWIHRGASQTPGAQLFDNAIIHEIRFSSNYQSLVDTLTKNYVLSFGMGQIQIRKIIHPRPLPSMEPHSPIRQVFDTRVSIRGGVQKRNRSKSISIDMKIRRTMDSQNLIFTTVPAIRLSFVKTSVITC